MNKSIFIVVILTSCLCIKKEHSKERNQEEWVQYWISVDSTYQKAPIDQLNYKESFIDTSLNENKLIKISKKDVYSLLYSRNTGNYIIILKLEGRDEKMKHKDCFIVKNRYVIGGCGSSIVY